MRKTNLHPSCARARCRFFPVRQFLGGRQKFCIASLSPCLPETEGVAPPDGFAEPLALRGQDKNQKKHHTRAVATPFPKVEEFSPDRWYDLNEKLIVRF